MRIWASPSMFMIRYRRSDINKNLIFHPGPICGGGYNLQHLLMLDQLGPDLSQCSEVFLSKTDSEVYSVQKA